MCSSLFKWFSSIRFWRVSIRISVEKLMEGKMKLCNEECLMKFSSILFNGIFIFYSAYFSGKVTWAPFSILKYIYLFPFFAIFFKANLNPLISFLPSKFNLISPLKDSKNHFSARLKEIFQRSKLVAIEIFFKIQSFKSK